MIKGPGLVPEGATRKPHSSGPVHQASGKPSAYAGGHSSRSGGSHGKPDDHEASRSAGPTGASVPSPVPSPVPSSPASPDVQSASGPPPQLSARRGIVVVPEPSRAAARSRAAAGASAPGASYLDRDDAESLSSGSEAALEEALDALEDSMHAAGPPRRALAPLQSRDRKSVV